MPETFNLLSLAFEKDSDMIIFGKVRAHAKEINGDSDR